nr:MAG TPA: zipper dimerization domain transcription factor-like protein [Caudoviricetes sp.]
MQRLVFLTDEYFQLKKRVKELENETRIKSSTAPRIIKMRIEKAK